MSPSLFTSAATATIIFLEALALGPAVAQTAQIQPGDSSLARARFMVVAVRFRCIDETWFDSPGADEVFTVFTSPTGATVVTRVQDSVDAGDERDYWPQERCILPIAAGVQSGNWACSNAGAAAPFQFTVHMFEDDYQFPLPPPPWAGPAVPIGQTAFASGGPSRAVPNILSPIASFAWWIRSLPLWTPSRSATRTFFQFLGSSPTMH